MNKPIALVLDDDIAMQEQVVDRLLALGVDSVCVGNMTDANAEMQKQNFNFIVLDLEIPARYGSMTRIENGKLFLSLLREKYNRDELPVIVITGHGLKDTDLCTEVFGLDANDFIKKPFVSQGHTFESAVRKYLASSREKTVADIWLSREKVRGSTQWTVVCKDGTRRTASIRSDCKRNKILEVIYLKQNDGVIPHQDIYDGCNWDEFEYFKKEKNGSFSAKRGPLRSQMSRIEKALGIIMEIRQDGVDITRPEHSI